MSDIAKNEKRLNERHLLEAEVMFNTKNDIYMAKTVDISKGGIRIVTEKPINIRFQIKENNKLVLYDSQLVWAQVKDDGSMEYGLKY
jgi:c-di-GMP-binding flagellar brake protein YcgR